MTLCDSMVGLWWGDCAAPDSIACNGAVPACWRHAACSHAGVSHTTQSALRPSACSSWKTCCACSTARAGRSGW